MIKIQDNAGHVTNINQQISCLSSKQRLTRALKAALFGLGLAIVALPIPGVHFVLVPAFLIFAFYNGLRKFKEAMSLDLTLVNCPCCQKNLNESMIYFSQEPIRSYCFNCRSQLTLHSV